MPPAAEAVRRFRLPARPGLTEREVTGEADFGNDMQIAHSWLGSWRQRAVGKGWAALGRGEGNRGRGIDRGWVSSAVTLRAAAGGWCVAQSSLPFAVVEKVVVQCCLVVEINMQNIRFILMILKISATHDLCVCYHMNYFLYRWKCLYDTTSTNLNIIFNFQFLPIYPIFFRDKLSTWPAERARFF